ncbi:hypothetical protein UlMin_040104 [Ulmus minor]
MASNENGRPLPKFGEWDVNDPSSAEGFTVIFNKARNEKKSGGGSPGGSVKAPCKYNNNKENDKYPKKSKWFCCG